MTYKVKKATTIKNLNAYVLKKNSANPFNPFNQWAKIQTNSYLLRMCFEQWNTDDRIVTDRHGFFIR